MDKIDLSSKIKSSILSKNIQLASLEHLPESLKSDLNQTLKRAVIFYKQNLIKGILKPLNEKEILFYKNENIPEFTQGELILVILPHNGTKYIFQTLVEDVLDRGYKLKILSPRQEKRLILKTSVPVFVSCISHGMVLNLLQKGYYLIRHTNFSLENASELKDLQFYDLIFNEKNQLDKEFKKAINKHYMQGELVNISSGGICIKCFPVVQIPENTQLFYIRFELSSRNGSIKSGLLCYLQGQHISGEELYLHMSFLLNFKSDVWQKFKEILSPLVK